MPSAENDLHSQQTLRQPRQHLHRLRQAAWPAALAIREQSTVLVVLAAGGASRPQRTRRNLVVPSVSQRRDPSALRYAAVHLQMCPR